MENFIGEIRIWPSNFAPLGWAFCDGSLQQISNYDALFALVGTTYGGDGQSTFGLPNLQGRVPIHQGSGFTLGQAGGAETVTVITNQLPVHNHIPLTAATSGNDNPAGNTWGPATTGSQPYGPAPGTALMNGASVSSAGGSQPHENRIPYQAINYIIATEGIYPTQ